MANARSIIKGALRSLGKIGRGRDMDAFQAADGLETLNQMLGAWRMEELILPARTTEELTYSTSKNIYTIGTGGDLSTTRPIKIIDAFHRDAGGTDFSMEEMSLNQFNDISFKGVGTYPERYYYESEYPLGKIHFDQQPSLGLTLHLISMKEIAEFTDLTTTISLPSEYELCMKTNLAVLLAPDYGVKAPEEVIGTAIMTKQNIKRNARGNRWETMRTDLSNGSRGNIYNGWQ